MDDRELYAALAVVAGIVLGALAGAATRALVKRRERRANLDGLAAPAGAFVFWLILAVGIAVAISILAPDELQPVAEEALAYLPNVLVAVLLLIVGRALATVAGSLLGAGLARATGRTRRETVLALRATILTITVLLVLGQLGVNTLLLMMLAGAILFSLAIALALLVGLGGRQLAQEIAAGRYLRRIMRVGDHIDGDGITGDVVALHAATTEITTPGPGTVHIPNTQLLSERLTVRSDETVAGGH